MQLSGNSSKLRMLLLTETQIDLIVHNRRVIMISGLVIVIMVLPLVLGLL